MIRHPGSLRAFGDIRVTKLLFLNGILRKSHFFTQGTGKHLAGPFQASGLSLLSFVFTGKFDFCEIDFCEIDFCEINFAHMDISFPVS